jgi:membrane protein DedA with SNARE-associated domain
VDAPTEGPETTTTESAPADGETGRFLRAYAWVLAHWPSSVRWQLAIIVVAVVFTLAAIPLMSRVAGTAIDLGLLPYLALMALCWLGEGGALVPIPGVRLLSWVTIVQQGANLDPVVVAVLAAVAMAAGQTSYFAAARYGDRFASGRIQKFAHPGGLGMPTAEGDPELPVDAVTPVVVSRTRRWMRVGRERATRAGTVVASRMRTHPRRTMFAVSVLPSPVTTLATLTAAMTGIPFLRFFVPAAAGFLVFSSVLAAGGRGLIAALNL